MSSISQMQGLTLAFLACLALYAQAEQNGRAFALFNVIKFKNVACTSSSEIMNHGNRNGTCYTSEECSKRGGRAFGNCAQGFGTCCVFTTEKCGATIDQNSTYIRNTNFPSAQKEAGECAYNIKKASSDICHIRLDFEQFTINNWADDGTGGDAAYVCLDSFVVSDLKTQQVPTICGENSGQHMYLDVGDSSDAKATLTFTFGADAFNRNYEIKVSQITCNSPSRPPPGCLQYFTGTEGRMTTFNWNAANGHLANQFYNMCIRQEQGFCCTKYTVCPTETDFGLFADAVGQAAIETECAMDYIIVESSSSTCTLNHNTNRYCGKFLNDFPAGMVNTEICDCTAPFQVTVVTDATADATAVLSKGLCLDYVQTACTGNFFN